MYCIRYISFLFLFFKSTYINKNINHQSFGGASEAHSGEAMAPNYYSAYGGYGGMPRPMQPASILGAVWMPW